MTVEYLGNQELLQLRKTAFLASSSLAVKCGSSGFLLLASGLAESKLET